MSDREKRQRWSPGRAKTANRNLPPPGSSLQEPWVPEWAGRDLKAHLLPGPPPQAAPGTGQPQLLPVLTQPRALSQDRAGQGAGTSPALYQGRSAPCVTSQSFLYPSTELRALNHPWIQPRGVAPCGQQCSIPSSALFGPIPGARAGISPCAVLAPRAPCSARWPRLPRHCWPLSPRSWSSAASRETQPGELGAQPWLQAGME